MTELTHDQQKRASLLHALKKSGIGVAYADRSLDDLGDVGREMKSWLVGGNTRFDLGQGFDIRGEGLKGQNLFNGLGRSLVVMGLPVQMIQLMPLLRAIKSEERREELEDVACLLIGGFERRGESPMTSSERYDFEDFLSVRLDNYRSTSVHRVAVSGWYSQETEEALRERNTIREMR